MSHINPLIMKPNKVGISLQNAYAYVLVGSLILGFGCAGFLLLTMSAASCKELVARPCAKELVVSQVRAPRFRLIFGFEF